MAEIISTTGELENDTNIYEADKCLPAIEAGDACEMSEVVLCWRHNYNRWFFGVYDHTDRCWIIDGKKVHSDVTHWAFLPPEPMP